MNSQESREESSIDHNDESGRTCGICGELYSHTTTAGPGRSKRSCGCDVTLVEVADDTPNAFANTAIRALNATGDVETATEIYEGTRDRLVADGGSSCGKRSCDAEYEVAVGTSARCGLHALEDAVDGVGPSKGEQLMEEFGSLEAICYAAEWNSVAIARLDGWSATTAGELEEKLKDAGVWVEDSEAETGADAGEVKGTLILATDRGQSPTWHHSVDFDGDVHTTACGSSIQCSEVEEVELDVSSGVLEDADRVCSTCDESVADHEEQLIADGGMPETFDDLAGTCENCGDDVDPERLIEGECPGCHYRPAADGGTAWTDLTGFERDLLEGIRRLNNDGETTYGLAIKEELERVYGTDVHHGRLYPNLDDLVAYGLVEKSELDKRTNEYVLTSEAEAMLEQRARHLADACGMEQPVADGGDQA